jgi:hypothetical protein
MHMPDPGLDRGGQLLVGLPTPLNTIRSGWKADRERPRQLAAGDDVGSGPGSRRIRSTPRLLLALTA